MEIPNERIIQIIDTNCNLTRTYGEIHEVIAAHTSAVSQMLNMEHSIYSAYRNQIMHDPNIRKEDWAEKLFYLIRRREVGQ